MGIFRVFGRWGIPERQAGIHITLQNTVKVEYTCTGRMSTRPPKTQTKIAHRHPRQSPPSTKLTLSGSSNVHKCHTKSQSRSIVSAASKTGLCISFSLSPMRAVVLAGLSVEENEHPDDVAAFCIAAFRLPEGDHRRDAGHGDNDTVRRNIRGAEHGWEVGYDSVLGIRPPARPAQGHITCIRQVRYS